MRWEHAHQPLKLPEDLCNFYRRMDGLRITWDIAFKGRTQPLGVLQINPIAEVKTLAWNRSPDDDPMDAEFLGPSTRGGRPHRLPAEVVALDSSSATGRVALFYFSAEEPPEIWYQDLSCRWNYICSSFTDYFKVLVMHLGLPNWQCTFSEHGLDPISLQWFRFFAPERIVVDSRKGVMRRSEKERNEDLLGVILRQRNSPTKKSAAAAGEPAAAGSGYAGPGKAGSGAGRRKDRARPRSAHPGLA